MSKTKFLYGLHIVEMAFGGEGVAKIPTDKGDFIVFVEDALPGQVVTAKVLKQKKNYAQAKMLRVEQLSPLEQTDLPYQPISGAPLLRLPIEEQIRLKETATLEMFRRLGQLPNIEEYYQGYIASPRSFHYRNKMEYSFSAIVSELGTGEESDGFALGFKRRGQWWAVENLNADSGLFDAQLENALGQIRQWCEATGLPAWHPGQQKGFFRYLVVRKSYAQDRLLINLVVTSQGLEQFPRTEFVQLLQDILSERLAGLQLTLNDELGDTAKQPTQTDNLLFGQAFIEEEILGLRFKIQMQSFFQTNPACAALLYRKALDYVEQALTELPSGQVAMDLFCGTGTIAQLLRKLPQVQEVIGVDIVPQAIEDAIDNAKNNQQTGIQFYAADVKDFLKAYPQYQGRIGVVVLDPPRAGIAPKALQRAIDLQAPAIVYISCNPSTQARDLVELRKQGYVLEALSLVDQFPHTNHIESVAYLRKRV
jgi:23S rRNA (uracil-5-)-methyltransferase RumA